MQDTESQSSQANMDPNVPDVLGNAERDRYRNVRIDSKLEAMLAAVRSIADRQHTLLQELQLVQEN